MNDENKINLKKSINKVLFGGAAGFFGTTLMYPFDTIRTRLQNGLPISFNRNILYKGYLYNLSYVIPEKAVKFGVNEYLLSRRTNPDTFDRIYCGSVAGGIQSFITSPAEQIKIKMQSKCIPFNNALSSLKPFRGLHLTMARDIPFTAIFFPSCYFIKQLNTFNNNVTNDLFSGLLAASLSTAIVTPIDVIKTRYQLDSSKTLKTTLKEMKVYNNPNYLFRGLVPRILSVGALYSVTIAFFDLQNRFFNN